jgi:hypothetical protein
MNKMTQRKIDKMLLKSPYADEPFAKEIKSKGFKQVHFHDHERAVNFLLTLLQKNGIEAFHDPSWDDVGFIVKKQ